MGKIAFVVIKPRKDRTKELIDALLISVPTMRKLGLVTEREHIIAQAKDGSIIHIFEWTSEESPDQAAAHPIVQEMWMKVSKISDFQKPLLLAELQEAISMFDTVF